MRGYETTHFAEPAFARFLEKFINLFKITAEKVLFVQGILRMIGASHCIRMRAGTQLKAGHSYSTGSTAEGRPFLFDRVQFGLVIKLGSSSL